MSITPPKDPITLEKLEKTEKPQENDPSKYPPKVDPNRKETWGEVAVERGIFTGIGFGVNELSSIVFTDAMEHGPLKGVNDYLANGIKKTFNLQDGTKNGKSITALSKARTNVLMGSLLFMGTLLVVPMKWAKDNKEMLVRKANHFFDKWNGNQLSETEVKARDEEVARAVACETKQSWTDLIIARLAAMGAVFLYGNIAGEERNEKIRNFAENTLTRGKPIYTGAEAHGRKWYQRLNTDAAPEGQVRKWYHRYASLAGIETVTCGISSAVLEAVSKGLSLLHPKKQTINPELCAQVENEAPVTASSGTNDSAVKDMADKNTDNASKYKIEPGTVEKQDKFRKTDNEKSMDDYKKAKPAANGSYANLANQELVPAR